MVQDHVYIFKKEVGVEPNVAKSPYTILLEFFLHKERGKLITGLRQKLSQYIRLEFFIQK